MIKLSDWESKTGVDFLKKVGIAKGNNILDFGCNDGNYTIPAAIVTGEKGSVFAIDENESALNELREKSKLIETNNIEILNTNGDFELDFSDNFFDFAMLYDVLHYLDYHKRKILYREIFRIVKDNSILSVYPKHIVGNFPLMELRDTTLDELINEIETVEFKYVENICSKLSHDNYIENGCVINFRKIDN